MVGDVETRDACFAKAAIEKWRTFLGQIALSTALCAADKCPDTKPADPIPGCYGEPPCIYVRANFPGSQPACGEFDYCNCGGDKAVPLLPTTAAGGSSTWGCGAYTTVPSGPACPSSASGTPGNGRLGFVVDPGSAREPTIPDRPAVVTTGGPVSSAPNAFATDAPATTTLSYDGGVLIYTKNIFPDLTAIADPTTITATVTKTRTDGPPVVYTGPVVVGAGGTWWGPPGTAPLCVYPFCTISGPPGAESNGADGGGSAAFQVSGPPPGPPPTSGRGSTGNPLTPNGDGTTETEPDPLPKEEPPKDEPPKDEPPKDEDPKDEPQKDEPPKDEPGKDEPDPPENNPNPPESNPNPPESIPNPPKIEPNPPTIGPNPPKSEPNPPENKSDPPEEGKSDPPKEEESDPPEEDESDPPEEEQEDPPEEEEEDPPEEPQACPGAAKVRRSLLPQIFGNRLFKRGEETTTSMNPLKEAFNKFGKDQNGNSLASKAIDSTKQIFTNKFPDKRPRAYVTGLNGKIKLEQKLTVGEIGDNVKHFKRGDEVFWEVRWDYERPQNGDKGIHVNAEIGSSKFAIKLHPDMFVKPKKEGANPQVHTMNIISQKMNTITGYDGPGNTAKYGPLNWDSAGGEEAAKEKLKEEWKRIVEGPCSTAF
ncbi:MAG: hypothetical protein Q9226_002647 [Calogaya cf. arnoldii]